MRTPPCSSALLVPPTVLIVEDEVGLVELLRFHFRHVGYAIMTASDGLTALQSLERKRPDVIVLDLNLPVMSGFRLLQLMNRVLKEPHPRIVVITAHSFQEAREVAKFGVDRFIEKPFEPEMLVQAVQAVLSAGTSAQPTTP